MRSRLIRLMPAMALAFWLTPAAGAEQTIHEAAKASVDSKKVVKTEMAGFGIVKTHYRDSRTDGGILIGFDVAISKSWDTLNIAALRPVYMTPAGEITGSAAGSMYAAKNHPVLRTVRLAAKPGYAVGAVNLRAGLHISGMSVTFMPIKGTTLDPKGAYRSQWVGDMNGASDPRVLSSKGAPIVGMYGNVDGSRVIAFGLLFTHPVETDDDPADDPPEIKAEPPSKAAAAPPVAELEQEPMPESQSHSVWLPIGIAVLVVLGLGAFLLMAVTMFTGSSNKSNPNKSAPKPRGPSPPVPRKAKPPVGPVCADDENIPFVLPCQGP